MTRDHLLAGSQAPVNYYLEHDSINRPARAAFGQTYLPPIKH